MWYTVSTYNYAWYLVDCSFEVVLLWASTGDSYSHQFSWISMILLWPVQWYLCILDTLRPFISVLIIKVNLYVKVLFMTINECVDYANVKSLIKRFHCSYTVSIHRMKWLCQGRQRLVLVSMSVITWGYCSSAFAGTACTYFILHNINALHLNPLYVVILYGSYASKYGIISILVTDP